jgi:hypothetical protein
MAEIEIHGSGGSDRRPLATSTLLGRHMSCTWRVPVPQVPLFWLELRWAGGWAWRALAAAEETRGAGRALPGGWRRLAAGGRVVGPGGAAVVLVEGGPPEPFAVDLERGDIASDDALDELVEDRADGPWPVDAEAQPWRLRPLEDGEVFRAGGRLLRYHGGGATAATRRSAASLASPRCALYLAAADRRWTLTVVNGDAEVQLSSEAVRALVPYAEARRDDLPRGGWLDLDDALVRWQDLGGRADSARERIAQDRSRLCRALGRAGVAAAPSLFETARRGEGWYTRLALPGDRVSID